MQRWNDTIREAIAVFGWFELTEPLEALRMPSRVLSETLWRNFHSLTNCSKSHGMDTVTQLSLQVIEATGLGLWPAAKAGAPDEK